MAAAERRWSVAGVSLAVLWAMALLQGLRSALARTLELGRSASVPGWVGRMAYHHFVVVMMPRWRARH